jgi:hypothetical protein
LPIENARTASCGAGIAARHGRRSVTAAAKHDQRDNDDPAAAVIAAKQTAKTIVVHTNSSFKSLGSKFPPSLSLYESASVW